MKNYTTKSKLLGYKVGLNNDHIYVAVPKKYFDKYDSVNVNCDGVKKIFLATDKEAEATLKDKYHLNENYTLYYFKWSD